MELLVSKANDDVDGRLYTKEEIAKLPAFSNAVAERAYYLTSKFGHVAIDNKRGLGNTPDCGNVLYKGFVYVLPIETLISLFPNMREREHASFEFVDLMKSGYSIASPNIYMDIDPFVENSAGIACFTGHEGRARTWALKKLGVQNVPVSFLFNGYRARHVNKRGEDFRNWLNQGVQPERSQRVINDLFPTPIEFA